MATRGRQSSTGCSESKACNVGMFPLHCILLYVFLGTSFVVERVGTRRFSSKQRACSGGEKYSAAPVHTGTGLSYTFVVACPLPMPYQRTTSSLSSYVHFRRTRDNIDLILLSKMLTVPQQQSTYQHNKAALRTAVPGTYYRHSSTSVRLRVQRA